MYEEELFKAVKNNDIEKVKKLVEYGTDINDKNYKDETALFIALEKGYLEIVKYLVENGTDVNAKCHAKTALIIALQNGYLEIVKYLVEHVADINAKDFCNSSALISAAVYNHLEIVKYFIEEKEMDINHAYGNGWTVLMTACDNGHLNIVKYLIEHGANINAKTNHGSTVLMEASYGSRFANLETVKYLVEEKGMDINHADDKGWTALTCSITGKSFGIFKYLVEHGANINVKDKYGKTVLDLAFSLEVHTYRKLKEYLEIVKYLLDKDVDINVENEFRLNDLIVKASGWGDLELVKCLLDKGVDINSKDSGSDTALMRACYYEKLEVVKYLIKNGADVNIKNDNGKTALNRAEPYIGSSICFIGFGEKIDISRETIDEIVKILIEAVAK